jgi:hypothetical protein
MEELQSVEPMVEPIPDEPGYYVDLSIQYWIKFAREQCMSDVSVKEVLVCLDMLANDHYPQTGFAQ